MDIELFVNGVSQGVVKNLKIISAEQVQKQVGGVRSNMVKGSNEKPADHIVFESLTPLSPFGQFVLKLPNGVIMDLTISEIRGTRIEATIKGKRKASP
jgi:hypothetical protein